MEWLKLGIIFCINCHFLFGQPSISYADISASAGVNNSGDHIGVSVSDFNQDGWDDIYVSNRKGTNHLYRNNQNGTFTDVASSMGVAFSGGTECAVWADINNDGLPDLFLGGYDVPCRLYLNKGIFGFENITASSGIYNKGYVRACLASDVDLDGDLDFYIANLNAENALFINNGNLHFENKIIESRAFDPRISMGATFFDYDDDGDSDLYLVHDAYQEFILYENDGKGHFLNISIPTHSNIRAQGMGVSAGDFNDDGRMDLYITNLFDNALLLHQANGTFKDIAKDAGVNDYGMGWGNVWLDCNNDGMNDIYVCNDYHFSPYPNLLYLNMRDSKFENVAVGYKLASQYGSYGVSWLDVNNDGKQDLFVANTGKEGNQLFLNTNLNAENWIEFSFKSKKGNYFGVGTKVSIYSNGQAYYQELISGSGYASQTPQRLHFGLGDQNKIDSAIVRWPGGYKTYLPSLSSNKRYIVTEDEVVASTNNSKEDINIPNINFHPSTHEIIINSNNIASFQMELLDLQAKQIYTGQWNSNYQRINLSKMLSPGFYLIRIVSGKFQYIKKIFIY